MAASKVLGEEIVAETDTTAASARSGDRPARGAV